MALPDATTWLCIGVIHSTPVVGRLIHPSPPHDSVTFPPRSDSLANATFMEGTSVLRPSTITALHSAGTTASSSITAANDGPFHVLAENFTIPPSFIRSLVVGRPRWGGAASANDDTADTTHRQFTRMMSDGRPLRLDNFPMELLEEIFKHLHSLRDIKSIRVQCHMFYRATLSAFASSFNTRVFPYNFKSLLAISEYASQEKCAPRLDNLLLSPGPEEPMTTNQLERLFNRFYDAGFLRRNVTYDIYYTADRQMIQLPDCKGEFLRCTLPDLPNLRAITVSAPDIMTPQISLGDAQRRFELQNRSLCSLAHDIKLCAPALYLSTLDLHGLSLEALPSHLDTPTCPFPALRHLTLALVYPPPPAADPLDPNPLPASLRPPISPNPYFIVAFLHAMPPGLRTFDLHLPKDRTNRRRALCGLPDDLVLEAFSYCLFDYLRMGGLTFPALRRLYIANVELRDHHSLSEWLATVARAQRAAPTGLVLTELTFDTLIMNSASSCLLLNELGSHLRLELLQFRYNLTEKEKEEVRLAPHTSFSLLLSPRCSLLKPH